MRGSQDKVAIVSGGATLIGAAIARAFVAQGARVVIADIDLRGGSALAAELGALASFVVTLAFNVPRNNVLASNTAASTTIAWETFDRGWSRANHLRGALAIVGAVVLTTSLVR